MFLAHSIRLRDPWQCEPTPEGGLRWSRVFHRPTGLESDDDLWLVISGLPTEAKVSVNGHEFASAQSNPPTPSPLPGGLGRGSTRVHASNHPSLTLPIKGRGPEDSSVESQKAPGPFRADLTPLLADANRVEITLPPGQVASTTGPARDSFPYDARLAIVGRS